MQTYDYIIVGAGRGRVGDADRSPRQYERANDRDRGRAADPIRGRVQPAETTAQTAMA